MELSEKALENRKENIKKALNEVFVCDIEITNDRKNSIEFEDRENRYRISIQEEENLYLTIGDEKFYDIVSAEVEVDFSIPYTNQLTELKTILRSFVHTMLEAR